MQKLSIKQLIIITLCLLVLVVGCMTIHQRRHFNKNVKIDNVSVGGLTAKQALKRLQDNPQVLTNKKLKMHYIVSILSSHHQRQRILRLSLKMLIKMKYQRLIKQSVKR